MEIIDFIYIGFVVLFYVSLKFSYARQKRKGKNFD